MTLHLHHQHQRNPTPDLECLQDSVNTILDNHIRIYQTFMLDYLRLSQVTFQDYIQPLGNYILSILILWLVDDIIHNPAPAEHWQSVWRYRSRRLLFASKLNRKSYVGWDRIFNLIWDLLLRVNEIGNPISYELGFLISFDRQ